jgi:hypothetical protein
MASALAILFQKLISRWPRISSSRSAFRPVVFEDHLVDDGILLGQVGFFLQSPGDLILLPQQKCSRREKDN